MALVMVNRFVILKKFVAVVVVVRRDRWLGWLIDGTTDPSLDSD